MGAADWRLSHGMWESARRMTNEESTPLKHFAVFMAHPDDAEFLVGGSVAKWTSEGHKVTYVLITNGDKGTEDPEMTSERLVAIREAEQRAACKILGVEDVIFLRNPDNSLNGRDRNLQRDLTRVMRQLKPDVVLCQDPSLFWRESDYINHPDHRNAGEAVVAAAFPSAGSRGSFPELLDEGLEPVKIKEVWIMGPLVGDTWVDISETLPRKLDALRAHVSQLGDWDPEEEITKWAADTGKSANPPLAFAEEFRSFKTSG
jgi:LmbE family N-acetylglucosaminyl deacetylase